MCTTLATRDQLDDAIRTDEQKRHDERHEFAMTHVIDYFGKAYADLLVVNLTDTRFIEIKTAHGTVCTVFGCLVDGDLDFEGFVLRVFATLPKKDTRWARRRGTALSKTQALNILGGTTVH